MLSEPSATEPTGLLLIVSGPAGSGKTTVCERLLEAQDGLERVVTATTRAPRGKEKDGIDYHFTDRAAFQAKVESGAFYEHALVHGNYYGTLKTVVEEKLKAGIHLLLNIDVQGAASFRKTAGADPLLHNHMKTVFIMPPDMSELERRLRGRGTDAPEEVERRLKVARDEITQATHYDHVMRSSDRESDFRQLLTIYRSEIIRLRPPNASGGPSTSA